MLGEKLDYLLLRPFTHRRNIATEEDLDSQFVEGTPIDIDDAGFRLQKLVRRLEGHFPISKDLRYLDIGCGRGDITIALARAGCNNVTGIDIMPRNIANATWNAKKFQADHLVKFICGDIGNCRLPLSQYDVIFSHEALEHIENPKLLLQNIRRLLAPNGFVALAFGPLFYSPIGDHMEGFFRVLIPWRGAIFSEKAILRLRRECFRPTDPADRYQQICGGLNLMRYSEFLKWVNETGWEFSFLAVNPQLKRMPPFYRLSCGLIRIPGVRDYIAASVYATLRLRPR